MQQFGHWRIGWSPQWLIITSPNPNYRFILFILHWIYKDYIQLVPPRSLLCKFPCPSTVNAELLLTSLLAIPGVTPSAVSSRLSLKPRRSPGLVCSRTWIAMRCRTDWRVKHSFWLPDCQCFDGISSILTHKFEGRLICPVVVNWTDRQFRWWASIWQENRKLWARTWWIWISTFLREIFDDNLRQEIFSRVFFFLRPFYLFNWLLAWHFRKHFNWSFPQIILLVATFIRFFFEISSFRTWEILVLN